jgi:hypothetical protein
VNEPIEIFWPEDGAKLKRWLDSTGPERLTDTFECNSWKEWWSLFELSNRHLPESVWPTQFIATKNEAPDFSIHTESTLFGLEVTEATTTEDRAAIKTSRGNEVVTLVGEPVVRPNGKLIPGGRFHGGVIGDDAEKEMCLDVFNAIERKLKKPCAEGATLLIYPNSNASFFVDPYIVREKLSRQSIGTFKKVIVLVGQRKTIVADFKSVEIYEWADRFVVNPALSWLGGAGCE